jgi:AmiR/NasT family two-component response regulator
VVVEQAKGVLAATEGITVREAFEQIRRLARQRGVSVKAVADAVVNNELRPEAVD